MKIDRQILRNFSFLSLVQVSNVLFPLITTPYIVGTIGLDMLGKVTTCTTVFVFLSGLTEFGFNISGTRAIAICKQESGDMSALFGEIVGAKLVLLALSGLIFCGLMAYIPLLQDLKWLYIFSLPLLIGNALDPLWFFIGVEETRFLSVSNLVSKLLYLVSVFVFVHTPSDYILLNFLYGFSVIAAATMSFFYLRKKYQLNFSSILTPSVFRRIKQAFPFYLSAFSMQISQNANVLILQNFQTDYEVGIFGLIQKLITMAKMVVTSFNSAIFAKACAAIVADDAAAKRSIFRHAYLPFVGLVVVGGGVGWLVSDWVIWYFSGFQFEPTAANLLRGSLLIPVFQVLNIPATLTLQALNRRRIYLVVVVLSAVIGLALTWWLTAQFALTGTVAATVLSELALLILVCFFAFFWKKN